LLLVSKPPARHVVEALADATPGGMRVVASFVGWDGGEAPFEVHSTLEGGALAVAGAEAPAVGAGASEGRAPSAGRRLLGLYSGGSLAHEATTIARARLGSDGGHVILDLGDERYTRGRPHPMVDLSSRIDLLEEAAEGEAVGCVLMDVVLGHGAHPDPAAELAPAIERVTDRVAVVAHVCGTDADPQDAGRQAAALGAAGALLARSNAAAARLAVELVR
jgi:FdrA protein